MNDEQMIIEQAQAGSVDRFSDLVRAHQDAIRAFVAVRLNNRCEAEDLAQEVFLIAWQKLPDYDHSASFRAWLRGIAHNLVRNHWRKNRPMAAGTGAELEALLQVELDHRHGNAEDRLVALRSCFANLGEDTRQILQWRYFEALPIAEIGKRLGRGHSTVTMMLHRMRLALRTCIQLESNS